MSLCLSFQLRLRTKPYSSHSTQVQRGNPNDGAESSANLSITISYKVEIPPIQTVGLWVCLKIGYIPNEIAIS